MPFPAELRRPLAVRPQGLRGRAGAGADAGRECRELVFAPPEGARPCNVHVREADGPNARFALLFRDYLRADARARQAWGDSKRRLALAVPDLAGYGQVRAPATLVLMAAAERWAAATGWSVPPPATPGPAPRPRPRS